MLFQRAVLLILCSLFCHVMSLPGHPFNYNNVAIHSSEKTRNSHRRIMVRPNTLQASRQNSLNSGRTFKMSRGDLSAEWDTKTTTLEFPTMDLFEPVGNVMPVVVFFGTLADSNQGRVFGLRFVKEHTGETFSLLDKFKPMSHVMFDFVGTPFTPGEYRLQLVQVGWLSNEVVAQTGLISMSKDVYAIAGSLSQEFEKLAKEVTIVEADFSEEAPRILFGREALSYLEMLYQVQKEIEDLV